MRRNLGDTGLRRRRRAVDPMQEFDRLPQPLRAWLAQAALPWSPTSARRLWVRAIGKGHSVDETLAMIAAIEARRLDSMR